jgi:hypothetical protein
MKNTVLIIEIETREGGETIIGTLHHHLDDVGLILKVPLGPKAHVTTPNPRLLLRARQALRRNPLKNNRISVIQGN